MHALPHGAGCGWRRHKEASQNQLYDSGKNASAQRPDWRRRRISMESPNWELHTHTHDCVKKGSDDSHFNLTLIVRGKVTWQCNSKLHAFIQGKINPTKDTSSEKTPPLPHSTQWHMYPSFQVHSHDSVRRPQHLKREESRSWIESMPFCLPT